ncbi:MAG: nitrite reductase/ring-hydroxylating ferredoxin subunit [Candidatus Azotimanducaceae bacterium]|jgi:nitrite reductase/ring-hydroxylating ferredoxin subunit
MPAKQRHSMIENPNRQNLIEVATYERTINASLERIWENVKDWAHLPHLHADNFSYAELDDVGTWGWRIWTDNDHASHVEVCYDEENSQYVARSYQSDKQVSEIWTRVVSNASLDNNVSDISVRFLLPDIPAEKVERVGALFLNLYTTLWTEDEAMMRERQAQLDSQGENSTLELNLGPKSLLVDTLPSCFRLKKGLFRLYEQSGELKVHSAICPHNLGPLTGEIASNTTTCPWHGYIFDVTTGQCVSPPEATCKLSKPPRIIYRSTADSSDDDVILSFL